MSTEHRHGVRRSSALAFIVTLSAVGLLVDLTYEGAYSIAGPFLASLGANATTVGIVAGLGEMTGYLILFARGMSRLTPGKYWLMTIAGYGVVIVAVPLLAAAFSWPVAAVLLVLAGTGKAIKGPTKDSMLAHASSNVGHGLGFGVHESLVWMGSLIGPLIVAGVLYLGGDYRTAFALLVIPAAMSLVLLLSTSMAYPQPQDFEPASKLTTRDIPISFWAYLGAMALLAAAYADFPLIAYHFVRSGTMGGDTIPVLYALILGLGAVSAILFGRLFDRIGLIALIIVAGISVLFAPLVFLGGIEVAVIGTFLWSLGLGAQDCIARATVASMVPPDRRTAAYGYFYLGCGVAWFIGSALMGMMYDASVILLVVFSIGLQVAALPMFIWLSRKDLVRWLHASSD